jgi:hypothetical protein
MTDPKDLTPAPKADLDDKTRQLNTLIGLSDKFGDSSSSAFAKNIASWSQNR